MKEVKNHFRPFNEQAQKLWKANIANFRNVEQLESILEYGYKLGLLPLESITTIKLIRGQIVMELETIFARIRASQDVQVFVNENGFAATVILKRGEHQYKGTFSMDEAQDLLLTSKVSWQRNPERMCYERAAIKALRLAFPEKLVGIKLLDEVEELSLTRKAKRGFNKLAKAFNLLRGITVRRVENKRVNKAVVVDTKKEISTAMVKVETDLTN